MREIRVHISAPIEPGAPVALPTGAARHVARVLRMKAGAPLTLFDGQGGVYAAIVESVQGGAVTVRVGERTSPSRESPLHITLAQGLSRGARMDYAIQKAVELGVDAIVPLATARSVVKLDAAKAESRRTHWQELVISACEQCGRNTLPAVRPVTHLDGWLGALQASAGLRLMLDPMAASGARAMAAPEQGRLTLLVGPEGGLEPSETDAAARHGFTALRLGPRVLRTETAAVAALASLQTLWGDLAS